MILGMKVRKHDYLELSKINPEILEFHFSDSDLNLEIEGKYNKQLIVHCYEYFDKKLLDIASLKETNQVHSQEKTIKLRQKAIDKTIKLNEHFTGTPSIIIHPGGYSLNELDNFEINKMKNMLIPAVEQLDKKNVNFLLENMPPYAWFFGGRWNSNIFLKSSEIIEYCKKTGLQVCFDICHSQLYCNKNKISVIDELNNIKKFTNHFHLSDADDVDEEGLQFGEGNMPFDKIIPILNEDTGKSFAIEVWKGHENGGKGFVEFLNKIKQAGLIVN